MIKREWTTRKQSEKLLELGLDSKTSNTGTSEISRSFLKLYTLLPSQIDGFGWLSMIRKGHDITEFKYGTDICFSDEQPIDALFRLTCWILSGSRVVYTSYYANIRNLPQELCSISIAGKAPGGFKGPQFKLLAPKYETLVNFKADSNEERFKEEYKRLVLSGLKADEVYRRLKEICDNPLRQIPCLICYEKSGDFCHRHLVADWFKENDIYVTEFYNNI